MSVKLNGSPYARSQNVCKLFVYLSCKIINLQGGLANVSIQNDTLKNKIIGVWTYQEKSDLSY